MLTFLVPFAHFGPVLPCRRGCPCRRPSRRGYYWAPSPVCWLAHGAIARAAASRCFAVVHDPAACLRRSRASRHLPSAASETERSEHVLVGRSSGPHGRGDASTVYLAGQDGTSRICWLPKALQVSTRSEGCPEGNVLKRTLGQREA